LAGVALAGVGRPMSNASLRASVREDLVKKGFKVTDGSKFGAHFLAYPGDPKE